MKPLQAEPACAPPNSHTRKENTALNARRLLCQSHSRYSHLSKERGRGGGVGGVGMGVGGVAEGNIIEE